MGPCHGSAPPAASRPRLGPATPRERSRRSRGRAENEVKWSPRINLPDFACSVCGLSWEEKMVLFSASISHFRGVLMDRWDASWLVRVILPSVLSITSPSGRLPLMPLRKKKKSIWEQSCQHTIC